MPVDAYNGREIELNPASFHVRGVAHPCPNPAILRVHPSNLEIMLPLLDPSVATEREIDHFTGDSSARQMRYQTDAAPIARSQLSSHQTAEAVAWPYRVTGGSENLQPGDEVIFRVSNLFVSAERMTPNPTGGMTRDTTTFTLAGRQWQLIMVDGLFEIQRHRQNRQAYHTCDLKTTAQATDMLADLTATALEICTMLQIATSARVGLFSCAIRRQGSLTYEGFGSNAIETVYGQDVLPTNEPMVCRQFLESTWAAFQAVKTPLNLGLLVSLYVKSVAEPFLEMRFIAASVLMEAFKHNYGLSVANHPRDGQGYFLRAGGGRYSFRDLLTEAWQHYGLTAVNFTFIQFRNDVFHTGAANPQQLLIETRALHAIIRKLLLQLVGYQGDFLDINANFARVPFVP